jgi:hypothetical protein
MNKKKAALNISTEKPAPAKDVDAYLARVAPELRKALKNLRQAVKAAGSEPAERHQGEITIESPASGALLRVRLPVFHTPSAG